MKMSMLESCFSNVNLGFYQSNTLTWIFSEECSDFFWDLYLSSESNNYCFNRTAQRKLSKCNWRNTAIALATLVKSHKLPKETKSLIKSCPCK